MLRLACALLVGSGLLLAGRNAVSADQEPTAQFESHGNWGILRLTANPGTAFNARGEQADGQYASVAVGTIPSAGVIDLQVPHLGPVGDLLPQYKIQMSAGGGGTLLTIPDDPIYWWLE